MRRVPVNKHSSEVPFLSYDVLKIVVSVRGVFHSRGVAEKFNRGRVDEIVLKREARSLRTHSSLVPQLSAACLGTNRQTRSAFVRTVPGPGSKLRLDCIRHERTKPTSPQQSLHGENEATPPLTPYKKRWQL